MALPWDEISMNSSDTDKNEIGPGLSEAIQALRRTRAARAVREETVRRGQQRGNATDWESPPLECAPRKETK